jgi:hypothetical protein
MFTLDTFIERAVDYEAAIKDIYATKAGLWIKARNDLVLGNEFPSFATISAFPDTYVLYRTFDKDRKLENGLSLENPVADHALFFLLHPPFPEEKESTVFITTKGTFEILIVIDHVEKEFAERLKRYIPCGLKLDDKEYRDYGSSFCRDFLYQGKKVGSTESMTVNGGHFINVSLNGANFTEQDRKDIRSLMLKYNDKSKFETHNVDPGSQGEKVEEHHINDFGGTNITYDQFKDDFINDFKDIIDFNITDWPKTL